MGAAGDEDRVREGAIEEAQRAIVVGGGGYVPLVERREVAEQVGLGGDGRA